MIFFVLETLPLIEFQLEDGISDSEALKCIQSSYDGNQSIEDANRSQSVNTLILDEDNQEQTDPFTFKLVNSEVTL